MTPGQLGEFVRAYYLAKRGYDRLLSVSSVVVDRLPDIVVLLLVGLPGFSLFAVTWDLNKESASLILGGLLTIALIAAVGYKFGLHAKLWRQALNRINWLKKLEQLVASFRKSSNFSKYFTVLALSTVLAFGVNLLRFYCLLAALGLTMPILYFVVGMAFASLVGLLPISVAGIGTRDVALILVFQHVGLTSEQAIAFSMCILFVFYLLNLLLGFVAWLIET